MNVLKQLALALEADRREKETPPETQDTGTLFMRAVVLDSGSVGWTEVGEVLEGCGGPVVNWETKALDLPESVRNEVEAELRGGKRFASLLFAADDVPAQVQFYVGESDESDQGSSDVQEPG